MKFKEALVFHFLLLIGILFCMYRIEQIHEMGLKVSDWIDGRCSDVSVIIDEQIPASSGVENVVHFEDLGEFTISHYCTCSKCCGKNDGITASGTVAMPMRTAAVDPSVIPLGTLLFIDGIYYVAEDTGGAIKGNKIDICMATHEEALNAGVKKATVFVVSEEAVNED